jgi:molybdopterin converting factor subunit 1
VTVKILLFAGARELSGESDADLQVQSQETYDSLFAKVVERFKLEKLRNCLILAINEEYPPADIPLILKQGDQIAVIPPLSGGKRY